MKKVAERPMWMGFVLVVFALVLAGCTAAATADVEVPEEAAENTSAEEEVDVDEPAEEEESEPEGEVVPAENSGEIMTEDDRPTGLQSITLGWETDWNRHTVPYDEITPVIPRDNIPALSEPEVETFESASEWLADVEPVIAVEIEGVARAYPLQILMWHEIANDELNGVPVAVTYCPLCNSALVFDSRVNGEVYNFGVSGLLRNSDLIMFDRTTESLWQQFTGEGIVGLHAGDQLTILPSALISFADFRDAYPDGDVLSVNTGHARNYGVNPYGGYDKEGTEPFLFDPRALDDRLDPVMRIVGVEVDETYKAYPYDALSEVGVINDVVAGQELVIFHQFGTASAMGDSVIATADDIGATGVFIPEADGQVLTFISEDGLITDEQTGSVWNITGLAVEGELAGAQLERSISTDHFWFSWAAFFPDTEIYGLS